ncbi:SpoVR family protein [Silvimonas iriomotensis]|uniref:SpoVR family protein n=1 Tax=Silvimonas iriomotensis TaxID=449662 RepID=A0ABQ2P6E5_9NEIS|nr:SpoVR family protein [Silvimonas iriomotensis]GGP19289.1 SpoVR family protein [Silvimonas iriomotensis]
MTTTRTRKNKADEPEHKPPRRKPLSLGSEWTFELIETYYREISRIAKDFGLDTYPNQLEIISAEQMMDAYASVGMPVMYNHWSFGKQFLSTHKHYQRGMMGLAYEIVINSNPCIAYLMEENTMTMQALVIAHASFGHNSFFKGNYLFRTWTEADAIIDYLVFAKRYIAECEARHGEEKVEELLDSCHALMNYGVDRYKRPQKLSLEKELARQAEREQYQQSQVNEIWRTLPRRFEEEQTVAPRRFPEEPQENLLYFIEKFAPLLEPWQREIVRIIRKIAQYFYPQRQTQVMNEGWATFWHYTLMNQLYEEGLITDSAMFEFLHSHTNVVMQPGVDSPYFNGINPYALGFAMYRDIQRICQNPTEEDKRWFPDMAGSDWRKTLDFAMRNFKDESFVAQYLSPKLIRDFRFFSILDDDENATLKVAAIHDDAGYAEIRTQLASQYNLAYREPNIQVYDVNTRGDRSLTLRHYQYQRRPLANSVHEVLKHIARLWGFSVKLESVDEDGQVILAYDCKLEKRGSPF